MGWISVSERNPMCFHEDTSAGMDISDTVIVANINDHPSIGFGHIQDDGKWIVYSGQHDFMNVQEVTHWMPLPEPPKE